MFININNMTKLDLLTIFFIIVIAIVWLHLTNKSINYYMTCEANHLTDTLYDCEVTN